MTDTSGHAELAVTEFHGVYLASKGTEIGIGLPMWDDGEPIPITLGPAATADIEVVDSSGRAVRDATVSALVAWHSHGFLPEHVQRPTLAHSLRPDLVVRVRDWEFADRGTWACIVRDGGILRHARLDAEGVARFDHLPPLERCQVWVSQLRGNRFVWAKELKPGATEIAVTPEVGGVVRGKVQVDGEYGTADWCVHAPGPGMSMGFESFAVGSFEVHQEGATCEVLGVPPGTWQFSLLDRREDAGDWVTFDARVGEPVVVDLTAE